MAWIHPPSLGCRFSFLHIPCGRCGHTIQPYHQYLVLFGGYDGKRWLNDLHFFDTASLVWSQRKIIGNVPQPRQYHQSEIIEDRMYIFGGYNGNNWLNDLVILDLDTNQWKYPKTRGDYPTAREGHQMVQHNSLLYIFGGWDGAALNDLYQLNSETHEWKKLEIHGYKPSLCGHSMNFVNDCLYVFGGYNGEQWANTLYIFNLKNQVWLQPKVQGAPAARGYHSAVLINKYLLIYAGYNGKFILGDLLTLDTETFLWSVPELCSGHFPNARNAHTMTLIESELYIFGGYNGTRDTNELHILETAAFSTMHEDMRQAIWIDNWKDTRLLCFQGHFDVHSVIIKARCPKLYEKVSQAMQGGMSIVDLGQISIDSLKFFCEYLYADLSREQILADVRSDLLCLALRFDLDYLKYICVLQHSDEKIVPESTLTTDIAKIIEFTELSDITVQVQNETYLLHKFILSARCPYFRTMLQSGMRESHQRCVVLSEFSSEAFRLILSWIYSDKSLPPFQDSQIGVQLGVNLLLAANILDLNSLMRMTEITLEKIIDVENAVQLYEVGFALGAKKLKANCLNLMLREFDRISLKRDFNHLSEQAFSEVQQYMPRRMKRYVSQCIRYNPEYSMIKWDQAKDYQSNPIEIRHLQSFNRDLSISPQNPAAPWNPISKGLPTGMEVPSTQREIFNKLTNDLRISGMRTGPEIQISPRTLRSPKSNQNSPRKTRGKLLPLKLNSQTDIQEPSFIVTPYGLNKSLQNYRSINSLRQGSNYNIFTKTGMHICSSTGQLNREFVFDSQMRMRRRNC